MEGDQLKSSLREFFDLEKEINSHMEVVNNLKTRQQTLTNIIHGYMKNQDLDEINVNNVRFSRVLKGPRKVKVKDDVLQTILMKHLGESGKARDVLEDLAKVRAPGESQEGSKEVLVKRTIKRETV